MLIADAWLQSLITKMSSPIFLFGFVGQIVFMMRFVVQWLHSERMGKSAVPLSFWYLSILGGGMLVVYGLIVIEPIIIFGNSLGMAIYVRNLVLIYRERGRIQATIGSGGAA